MNDLQTLLAKAFEQKDSGGRAYFPYLKQPFKVDGRAIPGGSIIFFPPQKKGIYSPHPGVRSAKLAIIYLDDSGTCVRTAPSGKDGISVVLHQRDGRNLPPSIKQFRGEAVA